jgi:tetratricopeptide (TPR) repeat protein
MTFAAALGMMPSGPFGRLPWRRARIAGRTRPCRALAVRRIPCEDLGVAAAVRGQPLRRDFYVLYAESATGAAGAAGAGAGQAGLATDRAWAEWIAWTLEDRGYSVYVDPWDIVPGSSAPAAVDRFLTAVDRVVGVFSPASVRDPTMSAVWTALWKADPLGEARRLIPVRIGPCGTSDLLNSIAPIDLVGLSGEAATAKLVGGVQDAIRGNARPSAQVHFPGPRDPGPRDPGAAGPATVAGRAARGDRPAYPADLPALTSIPPGSASFVDRPAPLLEIRNQLQPGAGSRLHAVVGPGGTGKTQLAVAFATRHARDYDLIWWIPARHPEEAALRFAELAAPLGLPVAGADIATAVAAVRAALAHRDRWLLILDDAPAPAREPRPSPDDRDDGDADDDDTDDDDAEADDDDAEADDAGTDHGMAGADSVARLLVPWLAVPWLAVPGETATGPRPGVDQHVLLTSRGHGWESLGATVSFLGPMLRDESVSLLRRRHPDLPEREADELAEALADLPLALSQGSGALAGSGHSPGEFLVRIRERPLGTLRRGRADAYPAAFTAVVAQAVADLDRVVPAAGGLARLCSFLAPQPLRLGVVVRGRANLPGPVAGAVQDRYSARDLADHLLQAGLASRRSDGALACHPLVQAAIRHSMTREQRAVQVRAAVTLLHGEALRPQAEPGARAGDWPAWNDLLAHALALLGRPGIDQAEPAEVAVLLDRVATVRQLSGDAAGALPLHVRALAITLSLPTPQEAEIVLRLRAVASAQLALGMVTDAEPLLAEVVRRDREVYSPDGQPHRVVAEDLCLLGRACLDLGRAAQALLHFDEALADMRAVRGPLAPETAAPLAGRGRALAALGHPDEAQAALTDAVAISLGEVWESRREPREDGENGQDGGESRRGAVDPSVIERMADLARLHAARGARSDAEFWLARGAHLAERLFGPAHPSAVAMRAELADSPRPPAT